ncbi:MAG: hypothetical protein ABIY55_32015, partial [Kofleriaceae bacterium]
MLGAAIVAAVCSLAAVALGNTWVSRHADGSIFATAREVPKRSFAIVPGASVRPDGSLSLALLDRLDAALELYQGRYAMALAHREVVEEQGVEAVLLDVGENHVELLAALGPETPVGKFLAKRGPGLHHV